MGYGVARTRPADSTAGCRVDLTHHVGGRVLLVIPQFGDD